MQEKIYELLSLKREQEELSILEPLNRRTKTQFGRRILDRLIYTFCDSQYISQDSYAETLTKLQNIFYQFKNESADRVTDDELLARQLRC